MLALIVLAGFWLACAPSSARGPLDAQADDVGGERGPLDTQADDVGGERGPLDAQADDVGGERATPRTAAYASDDRAQGS